MKKSTALEILWRYKDYSIVTVGRDDICDALADSNGQPFYDSVNLVYLWGLKKDEMPFEGPLAEEFPVRDYFALGSFADYLEEKKEKMDFSPWSARGSLGGSCTGMIRLLPFDLDRVLYLLSGSVIKKHIQWTLDDDVNDHEALSKGGLYADMGDWSPTKIVFNPDIFRLDWDCAASAECQRKGVEGGFWIQWEIPKEKDDEIDIVAEMEKSLSDTKPQPPGGDKRDESSLSEDTEEVRCEDLF